ncbi:MAG: hypothetical protein ACOYX5_12405 [Actinomycetota bacterium]
MDPVAVLGTVGLAVLCLVGYIVLDLLGQAATDQAVEALWRRPSLAVRRRRSRGLMKSGVGTGLLAAVVGLIWLAAATSGHPDDADDARVLGMVTAGLTVLAAALLGTWWRRSGSTRQY